MWRIEIFGGFPVKLGFGVTAISNNNLLRIGLLSEISYNSLMIVQYMELKE